MTVPSVKHIVQVFFFCMISITCLANNRIDTQRPDAPELSAYGDYAIGVKTIKVVNPQQINILDIDPNKPKPAILPRYDRPLTLEVWYPAKANSRGKTTLDVYLRDATTKIELHGKAIRNASPLVDAEKYPLVLISHGYPGNRFLLSHLAENIASKGYVVVSIDHTDSTYRTLAAFSSTLVNRPLDQRFTLNQIAKLTEDKQSFLFNLVDPNNTALIGYSMGAYGAIISAGGSLSDEVVKSPLAAPHGLLYRHNQSSTDYALPDPRIKTIIAFAPWGMNHGFWSPSTLKGITIPALFFAGSVDDVSGYEKGVRAIWKLAVNSERALLTFDNANHSAGAPMPAPEESYVYSEELGFNISEHYTDAVWDSVRMNNISQHFVTAWLSKYLKLNKEMDPYLSLVAESNKGLWSKDKKGQPKEDHSHWAGFKNRTAKGLRFEKLAKGQ